MGVCPVHWHYENVVLILTAESWSHAGFSGSHYKTKLDLFWTRDTKDIIQTINYNRTANKRTTKHVWFDNITAWIGLESALDVTAAVSCSDCNDWRRRDSDAVKHRMTMAEEKRQNKIKTEMNGMGSKLLKKPHVSRTRANFSSERIIHA